MITHRLQKLQQQTLHHGLDGLALVPGANLVYVGGIHAHLSERPLVLFVPADDEPAIIIPRLEAGKARDAGIDPDRIFVWSDDEGYTSAFQRACAYLELSDYLLGVEALRMRVLELELLRRYAPGLSTAHAEPVLDSLRITKDEQELAAMQQAADIAQAAIERLLSALKPGVTERQVAGMLRRELFDAGSGPLPFEPIVAFGPNSAVPHAVPGDAPLREGQLIIIDWGASVDGYASDITRTYALGRVDDELHRIYALVQEANAAGRQASRSGASGQDIDRAARAVIANGGYGDSFLHRTGHGLGLEAHENPEIKEGATDPLPAGAVFTIEPGIYLPDHGGVRIEDNVVLTPQGHRSLTTLPRDLIEL